jgi:glycosyl transferase, family 25
MTEQPPIYVINMAKDERRMASIAQQLNAQGLAFERVEAVVGRELTAEQKRASFSRFWYGLLQGRKPSDGELGCNLSHRSVWKLMLERGQGWAIIFEDDAVPLSQFASHIEVVESSTRAYDVVQFFSLKQPDLFKFKLPNKPFHLMTYSGANPTATAYLLRASGAKKLLKFKRIIFANDKWVLARTILGVKCGAIFPFMVRMHEHHSALSTISGASADKRQGHIFWRISVLQILRVMRAVVLKLRDV